MLCSASRLSRRAQAHGSLHFFPTARPRRPGRHRAVLLLPVAFKAGGLNLRFGTSPSDMRRVYGSFIDAILRPRVGSLRKLENGAADGAIVQFLHSAMCYLPTQRAFVQAIFNSTISSPLRSRWKLSLVIDRHGRSRSSPVASATRSIVIQKLVPRTLQLVCQHK